MPPIQDTGPEGANKGGFMQGKARIYGKAG